MHLLLHFFGASRLWFFCLLLLPSAVIADNSLRVLTSIHPLQMITNEIMQSVGSADVLIETTQSPHHFQLKPSQMRLASRSDLLIWISNDFETGLARLQHVLPAKTARLQLLPQLGLAPDHDTAESSQDHEQHHEHENEHKSEAAHENQHDYEHVHEGPEVNEHIWLSPDIVIRIARLISQRLASLDAAHASQYQHNTDRLTGALRQWQQVHRPRMHQPQPSYILDHQFLTHFEHSMGLQAHDSLRDSHDRPASIRHISELQARLHKSPVKCLLVAELPLSPQAQQISKQFNLQVKLINPLGKPDPHQGIIEFFDEIAGTMESCR